MTTFGVDKVYSYLPFSVSDNFYVTSLNDASNLLGIAVDASGDAVITASGGDISFDNENLSTTGVLSGAINHGSEMLLLTG